jgi:hypothetical protein
MKPIGLLSGLSWEFAEQGRSLIHQVIYAEGDLRRPLI